VAIATSFPRALITEIKMSLPRRLPVRASYLAMIEQPIAPESLPTRQSLRHLDSAYPNPFRISVAHKLASGRASRSKNDTRNAKKRRLRRGGAD
jgi:hypothetical protein